MIQKEIIKKVESEGYFNCKVLPNRGIVGLYRYVFTIGLTYGIREYDYEGRYCFESLSEAKEALDKWDGVGDPSGNWIKHKGNIEYSNPKKQTV